MPDGYINGKPDATWWLEQVHAGLKFRQKFAREDRWDIWRAYYRGRWDGRVQPHPVIFPMIKATIPRVYFRNPAVSVTPSIPGALNMGFAMIVNRLDNKLMRQMEIKKEMKRQVQHAYMFGTSFGKLGYGALFAPPPQGNDTQEPIVKGERFEYGDNVLPNQPWYRARHPKYIITPDAAEDWSSMRWFAEIISRPTDDIRRDPRLHTRNRKMVHASSVASGVSHRGYRPKNSSDMAIELTELLEITDAKMGRRIVLAPTNPAGNQVLLDAPDTFRGKFNVFPLVFNEDDEVVWGVSDMTHLEPLQLDINDTNTQMWKHRKLTFLKTLVKKGTIDEEELSKLLSDDVGPIVQVDDPNDLSHFQVADVIPSLTAYKREQLDVVRETTGFSRNQLGDFQSRRGDVSAQEASNVQEGGEIRVDERRDAVADMMTKIVNSMNDTMFDRWGAENVVDVLGPGGLAIWVRFDPTTLSRAQYSIQIDPDSASPRQRRQREQKAVQAYQLLKENPLIEPMKLTHWLLTELEGVEFDDLMRALPAPEANVPSQGSPLGADQLGELIQAQVGRAQAGAQPSGPGAAPLQLLQGGRGGGRG